MRGRGEMTVERLENDIIQIHIDKGLCTLREIQVHVKVSPLQVKKVKLPMQWIVIIRPYTLATSVN